MQKCTKPHKRAVMYANSAKALKNMQMQAKAFESTQKCLRVQKCGKAHKRVWKLRLHYRRHNFLETKKINNKQEIRNLFYLLNNQICLIHLIISLWKKKFLGTRKIRFITWHNVDCFQIVFLLFSGFWTDYLVVFVIWLFITLPKQLLFEVPFKKTQIIIWKVVICFYN